MRCPSAWNRVVPRSATDLHTLQASSQRGQRILVRRGPPQARSRQLARAHAPCTAVPPAVQPPMDFHCMSTAVATSATHRRRPCRLALRRSSPAATPSDERARVEAHERLGGASLVERLGVVRPCVARITRVARWGCGEGPMATRCGGERMRPARESVLPR